MIVRIVRSHESIYIYMIISLPTFFLRQAQLQREQSIQDVLLLLINITYATTGVLARKLSELGSIHVVIT